MWSLYILVIGFVIVYFLAYILKCILDYKKLKEIEEEECRTPSPATECFPLEQVVTVREIIAPQSISSPAIVSADEVEPKFHDVSKELEKSATDLENQALGDKESKDESTM